MKRQRNKDQADIRILKVELAKLHAIFQKYKETVPKGFSANQIMLPDFLLTPGAEQRFRTEELLVEIGKIKSALVYEIEQFKHHNANSTNQAIRTQA